MFRAKCQDMSQTECYMLWTYRTKCSELNVKICHKLNVMLWTYRTKCSELNVKICQQLNVMLWIYRTKCQ